MIRRFAAERTDRLDPHHWRAAVDAWDRGLDTQQIAALLGTSEAAVANSLPRLRRILDHVSLREREPIAQETSSCLPT